MGKFNCINRKSKEFKDLKSNLSKALGLTDITVTDETLLDIIDLFAADNDITEVEALDRMEELSKYIEDYFGFNTKYTPDSDLQEQYDEWFNDNIDYINTPYTPTEETNEFEEDAKVITEERARVVNLSNGQRMVVIPNSPLPTIAKEMQSIKEKAVANGTFMKAPNGKPTNLTEQQWLQVRTKAFKKWFGDWENNPESASKVVDENGEPLVVYHGSPNKFSEFNTDLGVKKTYTDKNTHFFTDDIEVAKSYGEELYPVFLNITNPIVKDFGGSPWNRYASPITPEELKKWEEDRKENKKHIKDLQEKIKLLKTNYEASIDENDIFGIGDSVILQEIQELESELNMAIMLDTTLSTPPTHTYSTTDELIAGIKETFDGAIFKNITDSATAELVHKIITDYVVKNPNQIKSATDNIGTYSTLSDNIYYNLSSKSLEDFLKNKHLVHKYNGQLLITKKDAESLDKAESNFKKELAKLGYSEDSVKLTRQANSIRVEVLEAKRKADYIEAEINHSMSSIKNVIDFLTEKIPALKDKVHYNVSKAEAKKVLGDAYSDNVNSFVHNGEIYLLEGKATEDIAIEEALHILTESLIVDNKTLAYELLHEAENLFPQLVDEIRRTYEGADTQNREILTQALARVFRQEFNEGERQTAESILSKFINWIKQLFGINPTTGNTIIELDELSTNMTLRDFAQLINSSNAEFRTWSHNKTQFNKTASSYNTFKDVSTEEEYEQLLVELELSRDKTDTFLYNFVTKILNVNPKVKLDKSIPLTVQNFIKPDTTHIPLDDQEKLPKRIFGVEQSVTLGVNSKSLKNYIELDWESDLIRELEILESTKVRVLDRLYKEKHELEKDIKTINRILKSREYASLEDLKYVEKFLENKSNKRSTYQHLGYELQKLNKNLEAKNTEIKNFIFKNASKKLAIKNRLVALKTIPDIKELIYQRLVAEKKAYTLPENAWNEHIKPWLELYEKTQKASKESKLLKHLNPVFDSIHHLLSEGITIKDLKKGILKVHPEYEELLNLIEQTNPNVVIEVLTDQVYEAFDNNLFGSAGKFSPKTNTVTLRETSDIDTIIHELVHAASYYGLVGSATRQKKDTLEFKVIDPFIKYINDYLKEHVGDFGPVSVWGVKMPASIYGFTNASEFIAELFSNNAFQELLDSIPPMEKKQFNSLLEEIISDIIDFIKDFFGVQTKETALTQAKQLAMAVIRTQQMYSEEIYEQLANMKDTVQKQILGKGELISSSAKSSAFARQLTNPGNNLTVEYKGYTFRNAEHAYQTWKSGEFDEKAYKSKAFKPVGSKKVNTAVNFDIMVEILTAKLQQHPELIQGINERGGLDYILNSTHEVTGDKYWESSGENKFIEALAKAYEQVSTTPSVKFTTSKGGYPQRRKENIDLSDITIALAKDFSTLGEKGTKKDAVAVGKYVAGNLEGSRGKKLEAKQIAEGLLKDIKKAKLPTKNVKLNIAGNGIYSLSESQEYYNNLVTDVIKELQNLGVTISEIRSGGQTGIDEAGIIAAQRLGIPAIVHGTKDWAFRGKDNKDVKGDEVAYKARFNVTTQPTPKAKGKMTFSYGKNKRDDITSTTTFEAIQKGERTATTRYESDGHIDYWKSLKEGDIIEWESKTGEKVLVRVTKPLTKLSKTTKAEIWSKKEGWSVGYYNKEVKPRLNEAWQIEYELLNDFNTAPKTTSTTFKNKPTLEDRVAEIEEMISAFNRTIIKDKDFYNPGTEGEHKYYIKTDKGSKKVDISVTALNEELLDEKFEGKKNITYPQGHIGNSFDALVRDYFNGGITTQVYPNFNRRNIERLTRQLDQFVKQLDEAFGKGKYKVITKDWSLGGYVTVNGKKKSVAGSIDMMVVTESGDIYIYDMKTTSKDISSSINKYTGQLTFYKELIGINYPEIAKRIKGVGLLVCDINFGRKFGSTNYGKYSIKKGTKDQLLFDGSEIQKEAGHINPVIQTSNTGIGGFILDLQASQTVEDLKMHPLKMQKIETEEDFVAKETQKSLFEKGSKKVENNDDEIDNLGTVKEIVNTDADLCPVPDVEITYLGNAIIKLLSAYLDELNTDDEARINYLSNDDGTNGYAEGYFTSLDRDQILTSDVFHKLLEYIKHTHFNPVDKSVETGSELQHKLIWIQDHFNAIVNSGFATLINLEKVALTMSKDTSSENENKEITRQLAEDEREESQQMAFDIDSKEKSYMDSIPAQLKTKLSKIYKMTYDDNGNPLEYVYDEYDYLIPTFEDKHYVVNTIMSLVHGCTNVNTMIEILRNNSTTYPWLNVVIRMLEEDPMLKTQFFRTFRKNATLYNKLYMVVERDKDGTVTKVYYKSEPLTIKGKIDKIVGNLNVNIEANNVPLFDKVKTGVVSINEDEFEDLKENITKLSKVKNPASKDITILRKVLRSLGFDNIDNVRILKDKKYRKAFLDLVNSLGALNAKLTTLNKKGKPFTYNSELNKSFYFISQSLSVAMNDEYEISVYDGGKSRMTYTEPTALQTLIETLGNVNPDFTFEDALREKYGKYAQFVNDNGYISSWLEELSADPELQDWIKHVIRTTFDDTTYLEQNDAQYALSLMLDYASPRIKNSPHSIGTKLPLAFFRVPIMSDKNSSESILFKTYALKYNDNETELEEMKDTIADKMHQFFLQEIKRMRSIYEQLWNEPETDVEFYHLSRTPEVEEIKKRGRGRLTVEDFLKLRGQKRFNGFKFHYTPMFNSAIEKDAKLAQMIVDAINGKKTTGLRKKYDKYFKDGVDERFESWKANIESTIPNLAKKLSASLEFIRTIPSKKSKNQTDEITDYDAFLQEYYWNDYLATCNIYNLTIIDPAFNKDVTDLQKRFAQVHSATIKCDTEAVFMDEYGIERKYSDGTFRFVVLDDLSRGTSLKEDIKKVFLDAAKKAEKTNPKKAKELKLLAKTIPSEFDKIDFTDGQGYSSPTGFWKKLSMLGEYDDQLFAYVHTLKDSLDKISEGDFSLANFDMVKQAFKPFVFGHSPHVNDNTVMGEYLVPTQIKDSEAMLVLAGAILRASESNHPLTAIFEFMENSHWKEENGRMIYQDDGIDTVVFHSAVKQGAYGIVNINDAKSKDEALELLNNAIVHELPYDSWGKQTEVPEHFQDHTQGMGSQQRVLAVSDIDDDAIITVSGKHYNKKAFLKRYFTLISKDMKEGIKEVEKLLKLKGTQKEKNKALSDLLVKAVVKDAKYTDSLRRAFTLNANGEFDIPLGDPTIADKFFSVLFSLVKNNVNLQKFPGGPTVQMSVYGMDEDLGIKYLNPKEKTELYCEAMITCPTQELENKITVTNENFKEIKKKFKDKYQIGDMLDVDDAIILGYMTDEDAWFIFNRIPTEDKYSLWACRVKRFLPRQMGEFVILPKETLKASGYDLDIDKGFITFKFSNPKTASQKRKNEIFELQLASLLHNGTLEKSFNPGSFDELKKLAAQVDPTFGSSDISLMFLDGQYYYRRNNAAGKQYVGIAALNNTCHGLCNMAGVGFRSMIDFKVNGISSLDTYNEETNEYTFDATYSIYDGTRISRTLGMFVGAAADNAKDAVLAFVGCTPTTGTFVNGLIRMGIPLDIIVYMMTNPAVKELIKQAEFDDVRFEEVVANAVKDSMEVVIETLSKTDFKSKDLLNRITKGENKEIDKKILYFLKAMTPYVLAVADTNTIMSLNSTKNSVGPDVYSTIKKELDIEDVFDRIESDRSVLGDSCNKDNLLESLPFLGELIYCYDTLIPKIARAHSPLYQGEFKTILKKFKKLGFWVDDKFIKQTYNAYLIYKATALGVLDGTYQGRKATIFETPLHVFKDKQSVENTFLSYLNIKKRMNKKTNVPTVAGINTGLSVEFRDLLSANWTALSKDSRTKKLSDLIIEHFLYKFGFMFNPSSPLTMLSSYSKLNFKEGNYGSIFEENNNIDNIDNFVIQYARNNPDTPLWDTIGEEEKPIIELKKGILKIDSEVHERVEDTVGIRLGSSLFVYEKSVGTTDIYKEVTSLGIEKNFLEYNGAVSGVDMETVITEKNKERYTNMYNVLISEESVEEVEDFEVETPEGEDSEGKIKSTKSSIYERRDLEELLSKKEYKTFKSKVSKKEDGVLKEIWEKLRRDKDNKSEYQELLKALKDVC